MRLNKLLDLMVTLAATLICFFAGLLWSLKLSEQRFDCGWLMVAFAAARVFSAHSERARMSPKDYVVACWPAAPGFLLYGLSVLKLRNLLLYGRSADLVQYAIFSCLFLVFVVVMTDCLRFGAGIKDLSAEDYSISRSAVHALAMAAAISIVAGTLIVFVQPAEHLSKRRYLLQSWLYTSSLIAYFILTMKLMLPLILMKFRSAFEQRDAHF